MMKLYVVAVFVLLLSTTVMAQRKSIAIVNDVANELYYVNPRLTFPLAPKPLKYACSNNQKVFAEEEMMRLLSERYDVELIDLPAECRKKPGLLSNKTKKWLKSISNRYDMVFYLYSMTKENARLFPGNGVKMYSSGLLVEHSMGKGDQTFIYTSITARAYSTEKGIPIYHLDIYADNAIKQSLEKQAYFKDINDPAICLIVSKGIEFLISHRYKEFVEKFENGRPGWDYTL